MEPKDIRELIELISASNFQTFELEKEGLRLKLVKQKPGAKLRPASAATEAAAYPEAALPADGEAAEGAGSSDLVAMESPIVGTFYRAPGPDKPNFVDVGTRVAKGQVMCIVEAMKVMNEIEAEIDAEVAEVLIANGQPVEYGEVMFRLKPL